MIEAEQSSRSTFSTFILSIADLIQSANSLRVSSLAIPKGQTDKQIS
jgi:hypothetical protein